MCIIMTWRLLTLETRDPSNLPTSRLPSPTDAHHERRDDEAHGHFSRCQQG